MSQPLSLGTVLCLMKSWDPETCLSRVIDKIRSNDDDSSTSVSFTELRRFWISRHLNFENEVWNFFSVVKDEDNDFIWSHNLQLFITELLERHPGGEFLKPTPEFQKRFGNHNRNPLSSSAESVIARILYELDGIYDNKIYYSQVARSCLVECWRGIDDENDFNSIREFFSYEHFYVVYCRFWALDSDHDFRLEKQDLVKCAINTQYETTEFADTITTHSRT